MSLVPSVACVLAATAIAAAPPPASTWLAAVLATPADSAALARAVARRALLDLEAAAAPPGATLAEAVAATLGDSVVLLMDGQEPARGRDAARALLARSPLAARRVRARRWAGAGGAADGTSGYTVGYLYAEPEADGGVPAAPRAAGLKYHAVWLPDDAGRPRVRAMVLVPIAPGAEAAPDEPPTDAAAADAPWERPSSDAARRAAAAAASTDSAFAARGHLALADAFAGYAATDGMMNGPGPLVLRGRETIRRAFPPAHPPGALTWAPTAWGAAPSGDLAYTLGEAVSRAPDGRTMRTRYLSIWRRQADGTWRYVVDGGVAG